MQADTSDNGRLALSAWVRALERTAPIEHRPSVTLPVLIESLADSFGSKGALLSERESLTYRELAERSRRYARWAQRQGLAAGEVVCLLMRSCPEYVAIWLGITRIGGVVALVNHNLAGDALAHSFRIVAPRCVIVGADLAEAFGAIRPRLAAGGVQCWAHGPGSHGLPRLDEEVEREASEPLPADRQPPSTKDRALQIYTSGTTGLPKAANVSHFRLMQWSHWFAGMMDVQTSDRMYNCLPLYHSIGGVVATGAMLVGGGSVVLAQRFSASRFWDDVVRWDCTLFQYIGELCRYLLNTPAHPREQEHRIRLCCGNGLRPDVWEGFKRRFRVPQILEFYAATEGSFSLYNCEGEPGAIGRIPSFLAHRFPVALVRFDVETGIPVRDEKGFCVRCSPNEVGEAIGRISPGGSGSGGRFEGYTDEAASERKILRDVFAEGDAWFRTGDLMRKDERGFYYFVDRVGDTFRWKGENVSATEVAAAISACPGVVEAIAYGVAIPGTEGRAGMAAVVTDQGFELGALQRHLAENLPEYARPLFLRISAAIETTATFKPQKQALLREGFDPTVTADPIYFNDSARQSFVRLDAELHERIRSGVVRL